MTHSFEFRQTGKGLGDVVVDGHDISDLVSDFTVDVQASGIAEVTLSLVPRLLMLALSPERVELDGATCAFLKALGWRFEGQQDDQLDLLINLSNRLLAEAGPYLRDQSERVDYAAEQLRDLLARLGVQDPGAPLR